MLWLLWLWNNGLDPGSEEEEAIHSDTVLRLQRKQSKWIWLIVTWVMLHTGFNQHTQSDLLQHLTNANSTGSIISALFRDIFPVFQVDTNTTIVNSCQTCTSWICTHSAVKNYPQKQQSCHSSSSRGVTNDSLPSPAAEFQRSPMLKLTTSPSVDQRFGDNVHWYVRFHNCWVVLWNEWRERVCMQANRQARSHFFMRSQRWGRCRFCMTVHSC